MPKKRGRSTFAQPATRRIEPTLTAPFGNASAPTFLKGGSSKFTLNSPSVMTLSGATGEKATTSKGKSAYIAGPMHGQPQWGFPAFDVARKQLESQGYTVLSPADHDREVGFDGTQATLAGFDIHAAMRWDIQSILQSDVIYFLDGWENSEGCAIEMSVAIAIGIEILYQSSPEDSPLNDAHRLVHGARQQAYGHPADNFTQTGRIWGAILNIPDIPPETVGLCMIGVKMSRESNRHTRDNVVDMMGYAETIHLIHNR